MSKNLIILLIVLVVAAAGLGALAIIKPDMFKTAFKRQVPAKVVNTNSVVTNKAVNTNRTYTLPQEIKGNVNVSLDAKLKTTSIHLSSFEKMATWQTKKPEAGKSFLVIYFDTVPGEKVGAVLDELKKGTTLVSSAGRTSYIGLKVANDTITNDHGYLAFQVPNNATNFSVVIGSGSTAVSLALPAAK